MLYFLFCFFIEKSCLYVERLGNTRAGGNFLFVVCLFALE